MSDQTVGERVRWAREEADETPSQLAKAIGLDPPSVYRIERGAVSMPHAATLAAIAAHLEVRLEWLITGEGERR